MKYPSTLTYSSYLFQTLFLYQIEQSNSIDTHVTYWAFPLSSRAGTIFTVVTAGLQIFGKGRLMARVDFTARTGVSSLAISKMDGAMGRAYW